MKLSYLKNKDINYEQWDQTIAACQTGLPYAYSWYLNEVAGKRWDALIIGDYEKVMPLPWNQKLLGFRQLYQPPATQQLGIFGNNIDTADYKAFLEAIPDPFKYILISIHSTYLEEEASEIGFFRKRVNLFLDLKSSHEQLHQNYSKSLKKRIRQAAPVWTLQESKEVSKLINFYKNSLAMKVKLKAKTYKLLAGLFQVLLDREKAKIFELLDEKGARRCIALFIITNKRIINVFGAADEVGKSKFAMHYLLDQVIAMYSEKDMIFDFEGSEVPGVAEFFRSYSPAEEIYFEYKRDQLPSLLSRFKERRS